MMLVLGLGISLTFSSCGNDEDEEIVSNPKEVSITVSANVLDYESVILKGIANNSTGKVGFCYSSTERVPTPENSASVETSYLNSDNTYEITISNLQFNTEYYYRAFAIKDGVIVLAKEVKTFKTESFALKAVDLGLSVKWANCNVGANSPETTGDYFAWGETEPKSWYTDENYKWGEDYTKYNSTDHKTVLDPDDDAAHVILGGKWRIPSKSEMDELVSGCTWQWVNQRGRYGYKITSKTNGNSIFLPTTGYRYEGSVKNSNEEGDYWSSNGGGDHEYFDAWGYSWHEGYIDYYPFTRGRGLCIRAVCE